AASPDAGFGGTSPAAGDSRTRVAGGLDTGAGFERGGGATTIGAGVLVAGSAGAFDFGGGGDGTTGVVFGAEIGAVGVAGFAADGGFDSGFFAGTLTAGGVTGGAAGFVTGG